MNSRMISNLTAEDKGYIYITEDTHIAVHVLIIIVSKKNQETGGKHHQNNFKAELIIVK